MITDRIENLGQYEKLFPFISKLTEIIESTSLANIKQKQTFDQLTLVPILSVKVPDTFDKRLLEAHKTLMDIHITLSGTDIIAYANLEDEATIFKDYDAIDDYLLANSDKIKTITVPKGYFCIIPNHFAHMALYEEHKEVKKIVVKMPAKL